MARMLQALKNLESRSVQLTTGSATERKAAAAPKATAAPPETKAPVAGLESLTTLVSGLASLETGIHSAFVSGLQGGDAFAAFSAPAIPAQPAIEVQKSPPVASTEITDIERMVGRTLANPMQSKPIRDIVERLRRDLHQTATKTVTFVGIGESSSTHEAILFAGTLLAQQSGGKVLIVDGDFSRRSLSEALEYGRDAGLTDALRDSLPAGKSCQPTATGSLSILPNGLSQTGYLSLGAARLGQVFGELRQTFDSVLIDSGRASDPNASALARMADATYLVVQLGTVEMSEAQTAVANLRAAGARVLGCIAV